MTLEQQIESIVERKVAAYLKTLRANGENVTLAIPEVVTPKQLREKKDYSIQQLADISGLSAVTLGRLEAGKCKAKWNTVRRIAECLGIEPWAYARALEAVEGKSA